jgi:phosphatidylglycerol:prolipoprotein diacylglycerol transferase
MHQTLFKIPLFGTQITIYSYGTTIVLAFLLAAWWTKRAASKSLGISEERVFNVAFVLLFLGLAGARLAYSFAHFDEFAKSPGSFLAIWKGGLVGYGGVVLAAAWLARYLPKHSQPGGWIEGKGWSTLDYLARGAALAFALGWIAPLLAGDDYGKVTTAPWGIPVTAFENDTPVHDYVRGAPLDVATAKIHPVQVYESLFALALFGALALFAKRRPVPGRVAALFFLVHPLGHALLELFRGDSKRGFVIPGALSWSQFLAIPVFFVGVAIWLIRKPGHDTRPAHRPSE